MSFPQTPAFTHYAKGWDEFRVHPVLAWTEKFTKAWDSGESKKEAYTDWNTTDFKFRKSTGEEFVGAAAWEAQLATYAPFAAHMHEPRYCIVVETDDGWEMVGEAVMFVDFPVPGGPKTHKDLTGRAWDASGPGISRFGFVKTGDEKNGGIRMSKMEMFSDSAPMIVEMVKRGMIKPEELFA